MAGFAVTALVLAHDLDRTLPLIGGVAVLWAVGTIDDRRHVSPVTRVVVELALGTLIWASGLGWELDLGWTIDLALTAVWVLGLVNAFNLFDNMDGASSTMALVVSIATAMSGLIAHDAWVTAASAALAGSCLGFLPHNLSRPRATIFLGDGGSMPLGFAVSVLVMDAASGAAAQEQALTLGLLLVAVPAFDTALVIVSRRRKGISVLTGGRDHLTHRTRRRLRGARAVAVALGSAQAVVAAIALIAVNGSSVAILVVTVVVVAVATGVVTVLEGEEDRLVARGEVTVPAEARAAEARRRDRRPERVSAGEITLVVFAMAAGASPFWYGFYDSTKWVPLGLVVIVTAAVGTIHRPPRLTRSGLLVLVGIVGYATWALISSTYAESAEQATTESGRWFVLAAAMAFPLVFVHSARRDRLLLSGFGVGITLVAGDVLLHMLGIVGGSVFLGGRLNDPLGYINAEGAMFLMGMWLALGLAESRRPALAAIGAGGATVMACLVLLSQSRGAALAAIATTLIVLLALPSRGRRVGSLLVVGVGLVAAAHPLLDVYDTYVRTPGGSVESAARTAGIVTAAAGIATGCVWAAITYAHERASLTSAVRRRVGAALRMGSVVFVAAALTIVVVNSAAISDRIDEQWSAFTRTTEPAGAETQLGQSQSRLVSGAGNRYEYWRVAIDGFADHPVRGAGAGNYATVWFERRHSEEDVRQPHSLELQALVEGGIVGALLTAMMVIGIVGGVTRGRRLIRAAPRSAPVVTAAVGASTAWLVQTSVDWLHLIPGVTAVALGAVVVLVRTRPELDLVPVSASVTRPLRLAGAIGVALVVTLAGALLTRQGLTEHYVNRAYGQLSTDPSSAIETAERAIRLDGDATRAYYAKAAGQARLDRGADADATLQAALRREPRNFVTLTLLGDLAVRRGHPAAARQLYGRASALNPRDPGLRELARGSAASG